MAQHEGYYSPNLDKNTTSIPGQVKYTLYGMRYTPNNKTLNVYIKAGNGKKQGSYVYADDVYTINCRDFTNAAAAVNNLVRNAKSQHKSLLSQQDVQKKIIRELNDVYYDMAGRPQHSGYYNPNVGYNEQFSHSDIDDDEVIDMTEIEDTLEHADKDSLSYKLDRVNYEGVSGYPNSVEIVFKPVGTNVAALGRKTIRLNASTVNNASSIQSLRSIIERDYNAKFKDRPLVPGEAAKAASKIWITFGRAGGDASVRHSAFQDQLASTDAKAVYYNFSSGSYDNSTKNVTLKFKSDQKFGTITVTCRSTMYPKVGSLPEMKEYVSNAFYTTAGDHQYLSNNAASKAAVYVWDAKNAHFGKANPLSRLQHSAFTVVPAYDKDYLEHHGILGMKWGVRRYQNEDGTLTAAGREHYGNTSRHQETTKFDRKKAIAKYGHDAYALQKQAKKALIRGDEAAAKEYNKLQIQNRDKQKELRREMADERVANYGRNTSVAGELGKSILRSYGLSLGAQIGTGIGTAIGGLAGLAVGNIPGAYAGAGLGAAISMAALSVPVASLNIQSGYVASRNISDIADSNRISGENAIRRRKS